MISVNKLGEILVRKLGEETSYLDADKIVWKIINGVWIGKRSVCTKYNSYCWLEDTTVENVKTWWCGKDSDYNEIFKNGY